MTCRSRCASIAPWSVSTPRKKMSSLSPRQSPCATECIPCCMNMTLTSIAMRWHLGISTGTLLLLRKVWLVMNGTYYWIFVKDFDYESKLCCFLKVIPLDEVFKQSLTQHELEFYTRSAQLITIKFQGFLYGMWLTGPWLGYKTKESPTFAWVGLGEHLNPAVQVWRHTCVR